MKIAFQGKNIKEAVKFLRKQVPDPSKGLPDEIFFYICCTTPMVNVDLLIKDEKGRTLLSWRDDKYSGRGWHVPGGIIRFREKIETRIKKVAESEIGTNVSFDKVPLAINELIYPELKKRSHFISILYKCFIPSTFILRNKGLTEKDPGYLKWHDSCPRNLLKYHKIYRKFL